METIKKYFAAWDAARIIKMVLGMTLAFGYVSTGDNIYLFGALFLSVQAILNIGCPGGSCSTNVPNNNDKQVMKFDKYEPNKEKTNV